MRDDNPQTYTSATGRVWEVLVCPQCGATSVTTSVTNRHVPAGIWWSRAGTCHLGDNAIEPVRYVPANP